MMNNRAKTLLFILTATLFLSALFFAELVTSATAGEQVSTDISPFAVNQFTLNLAINYLDAPPPIGYEGKIRVDPPGKTFPDVLTNTVDINTDVTLTPIYNSNYLQFSHWSGTLETTTSPLELSATQNYNITANFERSCFDLVLGHSGGGDDGENPTASPPSAYCGSGQYATDEAINLTAKNIEDKGWKLVGWSGTNNDGSTNYTNTALMDPGDVGYHEIIVYYEPICYTLNTNVDPANTGTVVRTVQPNCPISNPGNKYQEGTSVSLNAVPNNGYEFLNWTGNTEGNTGVPSMLVVMDQDRSITAHFNVACHNLTLTHTPSNSESGSNPTATPDRSSPECASAGEFVMGEVIDLVADPNPGWQVESWINTDNDESTSTTNVLTFPALPSNSEGYMVTVKYVNQPTLQFKDNGYRVEEFISDVTVFVKRTGSLAETVSVDYATANGTAKSGQDYTATSGTLTFGPDVAQRSFTVGIKNDNIKEGDESFFLQLSDPVDALLGNLTEIAVTIADDEGDPTVNFSNLEYEYLESSPQATISVTLFPVSTDDVFVVLDTAEGGTATRDLDYYWDSSKTLHFKPGETRKLVNIPLENDSLDEADETILLEMTDIFYAERGQSEALVRIIDDDEPPNVYFDENNYFAKEGDGTAPVTVTLSAASGMTITVDYEAIELSVGRQFADTIIFEPGEESKKVDIPITDYEAGDQLEIVLDKAENATLVSPSSATLTIFDRNRSECHQLFLQSSGYGKVPETINLDHSLGCADGQYVAGTSIDIRVEPEPGWIISGWSGTRNDESTANENVVLMPDSDHTVTVFYITHAYLPSLSRQYATYFEGPNEVEPNDVLNIAQANGPLRSGRQYFGGFPTANDNYDIFYISLADKGDVQVELKDIPAGRDYNLYLYTPNATLKGYSGSLENNDEFIRSSNLDKGVYFIVIHFAKGTPTSAKYRVSTVYD